MGKKKAEGQAAQELAESEREIRERMTEILGVAERPTVLDYDGIPIDIKDTDTFHLIESCSRHVEVIRSILRLLMGASLSRHGEDELAGHMYGVLNEAETKLGYIDAIQDELHKRLREAGKEKAA